MGFGSNFKSHWRWVNCISKWRSWVFKSCIRRRGSVVQSFEKFGRKIVQLLDSGSLEQGGLRLIHRGCIEWDSKEWDNLSHWRDTWDFRNLKKFYISFHRINFRNHLLNLGLFSIFPTVVSSINFLDFYTTEAHIWVISVRKWANVALLRPRLWSYSEMSFKIVIV